MNLDSTICYCEGVAVQDFREDRTFSGSQYRSSQETGLSMKSGFGRFCVRSGRGGGLLLPIPKQISVSSFCRAVKKPLTKLSTYCPSSLTVSRHNIAPAVGVQNCEHV